MSERHTRTEEEKRIDHRSLVIGMGIGAAVIAVYVVFYYLGLIH
jgi:hypothetical protein